MENDYQKLTEEIAHKGGLQTDMKSYYDPLYKSWMIGDFLRKIKSRDKKWGYLIIIIVTLFLLFLVFGSILTYQEVKL